MRSIHPLASALLALGLVGSAAAVPPAGTGGGYYGSAWFDAGQGIVVSGATYTECSQSLQSAINYRVSNWGWTVTELNPCQYRPPFAVVGATDGIAVEIVATSPKGSLVEVSEVLADIAALRAEHDLDRYEARLGRIVLGEPTR